MFGNIPDAIKELQRGDLIIVIDDEKVSFLPVKPGKFEGLIEAIPGVISKVKDLTGKKKGKSESKKGGEETE